MFLRNVRGRGRPILSLNWTLQEDTDEGAANDRFPQGAPRLKNPVACRPLEAPPPVAGSLWHFFFAAMLSSRLPLLLLPVLVHSLSLGSTLPARTHATRCSVRLLTEGDFMLQELMPAKAGILCMAHSTRSMATATARRPRVSPVPSTQDSHLGQGVAGLACGWLQAEHRGDRRENGAAQGD